MADIKVDEPFVKGLMAKNDSLAGELLDLAAGKMPGKGRMPPPIQLADQLKPGAVDTFPEGKRLFDAVAARGKDVDTHLSGASTSLTRQYVALGRFLGNSDDTELAASVLAADPLSSSTTTPPTTTGGDDT